MLMFRTISILSHFLFLLDHTDPWNDRARAKLEHAIWHLVLS